MADRVVIVATGARTPLGLNSAQSAASLRAGINRMGQHPFMVDQAGEPMPAALDGVLDPTLIGPERFVALAEPALREACEPLRDRPGCPSTMPLLLALPEIRPGFDVQHAAFIVERIAQLPDVPVSLDPLSSICEGHAAGLASMARAVDNIRAGQLQVCLVGGVDSYMEPETMEWLEGNRQLHGSASRSAFVPGEGAGFCLLMSERLAFQLGLVPRARILGAALGVESKVIKTDDICVGDGLGEAVRLVLSSIRPPAERVNDVLCDINGERYRGEEWGFVCLRLSEYFEDASAYRSPADSWGDVGAASGPLLAVLAVQAAARGYSRGPRTLLWAGSEHGQRGAVLIKTEGSQAARRSRHA